MVSKSTFVFEIQGVDNRPSCELREIRIDANWSERGKAREVIRRVGAEDCLTYFDVTVSEPGAEDPVSGKILQFTKNDCSVGLRYFQSIKKVISGSLSH